MEPTTQLLVIATTTALNSHFDWGALVNTGVTAVSVLAAGIVAAVIAARSTANQNDSENLRLDKTLRAEEQRAREQRLFDARRAAFPKALKLFADTSLRKAEDPALWSVSSTPELTEVMSDLDVLSDDELQAAVHKLAGLFKIIPKDKEEAQKILRAEIAATREIQDLMRARLGTNS